MAERPSLRKECAYAFVCKGEERGPRDVAHQERAADKYCTVRYVPPRGWRDTRD